LGKRVEAQAVAGLVETLRAVKSSDEQAAIRRSVMLNSRAYERGLKRFRVGMTERELAARIGFEMRRLGAEGESFPEDVLREGVV
jgi:Xaa-Pro aminopeptidase